MGVRWRAASSLLLAVAVIGCGGGGGEGNEPGPGPAEEEPREQAPNSSPIAAAGEDQLVPVGAMVQLDGRGSSDPDGDVLSFRWRFVSVPEGSEASLSISTSRSPRFTADLAGTYEIELVVSDGAEQSSDRSRVIANAPPTAHAGGNLTGTIGEELRLDGSGSSDLEDDELDFSWVFLSKPAGSAATLGGRTTPRPRFTPDVHGLYVIELTVSDGLSEARDRATVQVDGNPGFSGTVLYVSPEGDDENLGTKSEPLGTIGRALVRLGELEGITRIQLAAGEYEEAFDHSIDSRVSLAGPEAEEGVATLRGEASLFKVLEGGRLSLVDLELESEGTAIIVDEAGARLGLERVGCRAMQCVISGSSTRRGGGQVTIRDSKFRGLAGAEIGLGLAASTVAVVSDITLFGFRTGIYLVDSSLLLEGFDVRADENAIEIRKIKASDGKAADLRDGTVSYAATGILIVDADVSIDDTNFYELTVGVSLTGGNVGIERAQFSGLSGEAILTESNGTGTRPDSLILRESRFSAIAGPNLDIRGAASYVDLGNQEEEGGNSFGSSTTEIVDARPEGSGTVVSMSGNSFRLEGPAPGILIGPYDENLHVRIVNRGNRIMVY